MPFYIPRDEWNRHVAGQLDQDVAGKVLPSQELQATIDLHDFDGQDVPNLDLPSNRVGGMIAQHDLDQFDRHVADLPLPSETVADHLSQHDPESPVNRTLAYLAKLDAPSAGQNTSAGPDVNQAPQTHAEQGYGGSPVESFAPSPVAPKALGDYAPGAADDPAADQGGKSPDPPMPPLAGALRTGGVGFLPFPGFPAKPVPPSGDEQQRVQEGEAPVRNLEDVAGSGAANVVDALGDPDRSALGKTAAVLTNLLNTGPAGRLLGEQGQSTPAFAAGLPGAGLGSSEEEAAAIARQQEARGGRGGGALGGLVNATEGGDALAGMRSGDLPGVPWRTRKGPAGDTHLDLPGGHTIEGLGSADEADRIARRLEELRPDYTDPADVAGKTARAASEIAQEGADGTHAGTASRPVEELLGPLDGAERPGNPARAAGSEGAPQVLGDQAAARAGAAGEPDRSAAAAPLADPYAAPPLKPGQPSSVPAVRRIEEALAEQAKGDPQSVADRVGAARTAFVRKVTDRDVDLGQFQKEAEKAAGRPLAPEEMAYELNRLTNGADHAAQVRVQESLIPAVRDVGEDRSKLSAYLLLRQGGDARPLAEMAAELGPERFAKLEQAAGKVDGFRKTLADLRTEAGLPAALPSKPAAEVRDPLADLVTDAFRTERDARRNAAFQGLAKLADLVDGKGARAVSRVDPGYAVADAQKLVPGYVDGQRVYLRMPQEMAAALENEAKGNGIPGLSVLMSTFKMALTSRNPTFLASNAVLDAMNYTGRTLAREGGNPLRIPGIVADLFSAYHDAFKGLAEGTYKGEDTARYLKQGGGSFGFFEPSKGAAGKAIDEYLRSNALEVKSAADVRRIAVDLATLKPVETIGERIELAPRVAAMRRAEKAGQSAVEATVAGRTVTLDFAQGGTLARTLNGFVPFLNAAVQGAAVPARTFAENPRGFLGTTAALLVAPVVAAESWNRADPLRAKDYADIPQDVKDQGVVVMLPGEAPLDNRGERRPQFVLIKTREWTPGVLLTREVAEREMGGDGRKWQELAAAGLLGMSPVQGNSAADAFTNALPPPFGTVGQLAFDRNAYTGRPIDTKGNDAQAGPIARTIAAGAQALGVDAHPSQVEFALRDFFGGAGQVYNEGAKLATGEQKQSGLPQDVPLLGGFVRRFVRGDTGEQLAQARDDRLSDEAGRILRESGVDYVPGVAPFKIGDQVLTRQQQTQYQRLVNEKVDTSIRALSGLPAWDSSQPKDREKAVEATVRQARREAEGEMAGTLGLEAGKPKPAGPTPTPELRLPTSPTATRTPGPTNTRGPTRTPGPTRTATPATANYALPGGAYRLPSSTPEAKR